MLDRAPRQTLIPMSLYDPRIAKIGPESDDLLRSLFDLYIQEMAAWFEIETKADGSYACDTSVVWEKRWHAYLATVGESTVGFALAGSAEEWLGDKGALLPVRRAINERP